MIEGMRKASRTNVLEWLKELQQPRKYVAALSGKGKDLLIDVQVETLENQSISRQRLYQQHHQLIIRRTT